MDTHRGNGGNWTPDGEGARDDLPELPPEWGEIVIPDDPSALADEAERVRRELARQAPPRGWLRRAGAGEPSLGAPLFIMSAAVLITLVSLFAMAWQGSRPRPPAATPPAATALPTLSLDTPAGAALPLRTLAPAVIMLVEECACEDLVAATVEAAPDGVTVVAVDDSAAPPGADRPPENLRRVLDPAGELRTALDLGLPGPVASVLLVDRTGRIVTTVPAARTLGAYRRALADLRA
jgi:hypothetical protein